MRLGASQRTTKLSVALVLVLYASTGLAQSTDRSRPTPLVSGQIIGKGTGTSTDYWYAFTAGPGEIAISVDVSATVGSTPGDVDVELKDTLFNTVTQVSASATYLKSEQKGVRFEIRKAQAFLLKVGVGERVKSYGVTVSGAVTFAGSATASAASPSAAPAEGWLACVPRTGVLRIEMEDGTSQEINLARAKRVLVKSQ